MGSYDSNLTGGGDIYIVVEHPISDQNGYLLKMRVVFSDECAASHIACHRILALLKLSSLLSSRPEFELARFAANYYYQYF